MNNREQILTVLVEDSDTYTELLAKVLDGAPCFAYKIIRFRKMAEAVAFLKNHEVDLVLLDLALPDSSGVRSVERIKELIGQTALVVLTATDDDAVERSCIQAGAGQYIVKMKHMPAEERRLIRNAVEFSKTERKFADVSALISREVERTVQAERNPNLPPLPVSTAESVAINTGDTVVTSEPSVTQPKEPQCRKT